MKKWILLLLLLVTLTACGSKTPTPEPTDPPKLIAQEYDEAIVGSWVKRGEFAEDADYVETLQVFADGTLSVQLDFRGEPYQTLTGTWYTQGRHFVVNIESDDPYTTDYQYLVDGRELTLQTDENTYLYYSE